MRILFIIDSLDGGGKERQFVELVKKVNKEKKIKLQILLLSDKIFYKDFLNKKITINIIKKKYKYDIINVFIKLTILCKNFKPDAIHVWGSISSLYSLIPVLIFKIRLINGSIRNAIRISRFSKVGLISKFVFPFSEKIIANSKAGLKAHKLTEDTKNKVIYNGFDFSRIDKFFDKKKIKKKFNINTKYIVGMVANFTDAKDYITYIKAAEKIVKLRQDISFLCIGNGINLSRIKERIDKKNNKNILLPGRLSNIEEIVSTFDIGVLICNTIGHSEGLSNSIMEYMALEKPVIATESGGNKELVIDNKSGYIINPFDSDILVKKVLLLIDNKKLRESFGLKGKNRIHKFFNNKLMYRKYLDIYLNND